MDSFSTAAFCCDDDETADAPGEEELQVSCVSLSLACISDTACCSLCLSPRLWLNWLWSDRSFSLYLFSWCISFLWLKVDWSCISCWIAVFSSSLNSLETKLIWDWLSLASDDSIWLHAFNMLCFVAWLPESFVYFWFQFCKQLLSACLALVLSCC